MCFSLFLCLDCIRLITPLFVTGFASLNAFDLCLCVLTFLTCGSIMSDDLCFSSNGSLIACRACDVSAKLRYAVFLPPPKNYSWEKILEQYNLGDWINPSMCSFYICLWDIFLRANYYDVYSLVVSFSLSPFIVKQLEISFE